MLNSKINRILFLIKKTITMKKIVFILIGLLSLIQLRAQSITEKWPELKTFHQVMSTTFHPAEEGNFKPIRERSGEMMDKATALADSKIPDGFATDGIKDAVKRLKADSKKLHELVKSGKADDKELFKALNALHDVFHEIVGLCRKENEHH